MDNREAKFILSAYRSTGQDASDAHFAHALEQVRRDPMLEQWFRKSVAFDAAIAEKFGAVEVPSDLREKILVGAKISRPVHWSKRFGSWAIAAAIILIAGVGSLIWHNTRPARLAGWQMQALNVISSLVKNESKFDAQSQSPRDLVEWLRANKLPTAEKLPGHLNQLAGIGCKTFSWNGAQVSVICFMRPDGGLIHLVATKVAGEKRKGGAQFVQQDEWATATWREGDKVFMLALEGSADQLRSYL
jgi:hypothetical protein